MSRCQPSGSWCANLEAEIIEPPATAMIPQVHLPGRTAEVDFGDVWVIVSGEKLRAKMFAMRLSSSAKAFHQIYMGESEGVLPRRPREGI